MKKGLATVAQFLLFLFVFFVGSFVPPFHLHWTAATASAPTRFFVPDGLLIVVGVLLAIITVQIIRKRTCDTSWTILAFVLAIACGYAMQFGFVTPSMR
jgi:hypothetical protein